MPKRVRSEAWQEQRRAKNKKRGDRHFDRLRTEVEESAEAERVRSTEPLRRETMRVGFLLNEEEEEVTISQESPIVLEEPDVPVSNATVKETSSGNVQDAPVVELESFGQPSEAETEEEEARRVQAELRLKVSLVRNEPINGAGQRFGVGWDFAKRRIMERSMVDRAMEGGAWPSDVSNDKVFEIFDRPCDRPALMLRWLLEPRWPHHAIADVPETDECYQQPITMSMSRCVKIDCECGETHRFSIEEHRFVAITKLDKAEWYKGVLPVYNDGKYRDFHGRTPLFEASATCNTFNQKSPGGHCVNPKHVNLEVHQKNMALEAELTEAHEYIAKQDEYIATQDVEIMQLREQLTLV